MPVGEDIQAIMALLQRLYADTGLEYFKHQAMSWSQWVWMLQDEKRELWALAYAGDPEGADVCNATS